MSGPKGPDSTIFANRAAKTKYSRERATCPHQSAYRNYDAHHCTLVTHNTREFSRIPGLVLDDWQQP